MVADHVHQQHRANVETWRRHVMSALALIDHHLTQGNIHAAREIIHQLYRNVGGASN